MLHRTLLIVAIGLAMFVVNSTGIGLVSAQSRIELKAPANSLNGQPATGQPAALQDPGIGKITQTKTTKSSAIDIDRLVTQLALENMPHTYADDRKWGMQDERWDGLHIRRDGWKIKTKRRKKMVNHGTWRKYAASLINVEEEFSVNVGELAQLPNGNLGFDISFTAHLDLNGRQAEWVKGVQLYSMSVEGTAKVRLKLQCELGIDLDFDDFPPDVIFTPVVKQAEISVDEFKLDRVSKLGGEFAQQVTRASRSLLDEKITEKEDKLVEKINAQINKKRDRLRISLSEAIDSDWTEKALPHLPASLQTVIRASK